MKKALISTFLIFSMLSNVALAECNFSTGITSSPDGSYKYTAECHKKVGLLVQENESKTIQITDLNKAIELKDLAIKKSDERVSLWMDTSYRLEDRLNKIDQYRAKNDILYFGLGIATTILVGFVVAQTIK